MSAEIIPASRETIAALQGAPFAFKIAARAALALQIGRLDATLPDGRVLRFDRGAPGPVARLTIHDWSFGRRLMFGGLLGFAEAYASGVCDTDDLPALLELFSANMDAVRPTLRGSQVTRWLARLKHVMRANTRSGSKKNIHAHYDLGNEFYALWLDPSMTYSSALFEAPSQDLSVAQSAKYDALATSLALTENDHVLEIGSGWGGFAEFAARTRGARVTGITISPAQFEFARRRIYEKQLADKVDIRLIDYRDVEGQYDRVASIEMFEAVGEKYWPTYFSKVANVLKPGGRAGLQIITIREDLFESYRLGVDFIQRYIFPGGMLPSLTRLRSETAAAGLMWAEARLFGLDYAETLKVWRERFLARWDDIRALNDTFDERFRRLWSYYLAYCEAGFRTGRIDVGQFTLAKA